MPSISCKLGLSIALFLGCAAPLLADDDASNTVPEEDRQEYLHYYGLLAETVAQIELNHASPVERRRLFEAALRGMLEELDPYSSYLSPEEYAKYLRLAERSKPSFGVELAIETGRLVVLGVRPGSAAVDQRMQPGDWVLAIDGHSAEKMTLGEADARLADGAKPVELQLEDRQGEKRTVTLKAARQTTATVLDVRVAEQGVGYVRVTSFSGDTAAELRDAIAQLQQQGATSLIVDLRYNAGGLLQAAVDTADLFLTQGTIVSVATRQGKPRVWQAGESDATGGWPLAILVNRYSASASEVVAAALKDNQRAVVVGERTWGKGSVQSIIALGDGHSAIKLTTAAYRRPNGKNIHRFSQESAHDEWGVRPDADLDVPLSHPESYALLKSWKSPDDSPPDDGPPEDRQLDAALARLREAKP